MKLVTKILFVVLAIVVIPASLWFSFLCYMVYGLQLGGSAIGDALYFAGMFTWFVAVLGLSLGIVSLCKGKGKRAFLFVLLGVFYGGLIFVGGQLDEMRMDAKVHQEYEALMEEQYGKGWNDPPLIEGIPEQYQEVLNRFYVAVKENWPAEKTMDLGTTSMPEYYGDASTEQIGFALMDLNGDKVEELVIGTVGSPEGEGALIFCIYVNPENPHASIVSVEGDRHYLHAGQDEGTYELELVGEDGAWVIEPAVEENIFDFNYREGAMAASDRMELELIPFSQYK